MQLRSQMSFLAEGPLHHPPAPALQRLEQLLMNPEHLRKIKRIAKRQTKGLVSVSWQDAQQIAQLKLIQVVRAGKFRHGGEPEFYRWAATVARCEIIDFVRKEKPQQSYLSLDRVIPGTDSTWLEHLPDELNLLNSIELADLLLQAREAITALDQTYPDKKYLQLWQGLIQDKNQTQLAAELGITQGAVSKRLQELMARTAEALGLSNLKSVKKELQTLRNQKADRKRSDTQW
jgi:RNA polymerase sigma factor (sigma-70 family)